MESPLYWMQQPLKKYADFSGRARRMEFWMFVLLQIALSIVASLLDGVLGLAQTLWVYGPFQLLCALAFLVPNIAVSVRRFHDQDKSGWLTIMAFIPLVNIVWLVFMFLEGTRGPNQYGPDPKGGVDAAPAM